MAGPSSEVSTSGELAAALKDLAAGLSYSQLDMRARALPGTQTLPKSTLGDMFNGKLPSRDTLLTYLTVCGVSPADQRQWLGAWQRARDGRRRRGGTLVRDVSPRELGVHAAIREQDSTDDLPPYVPRDFDTALRAAVSTGVEQGCFVLLVGASSVGKTRSAYEAVLALAPDWWLVQPAEVAGIRALADTPVRHTVVWLDELQRYLDQRQPVAEWVRTLRRAGAIVLGTLWADEYLTRAVPNGKDQKNPDHELLRMAYVIDVAGDLTGHERERAVSLGEEDSRIRTALGVSDAGFVQVLAAGPALMRWWEQSPSPYARAVITAAADARRLGVRSPLPRGFFADAIGGYLTPAQRAIAPPGWLDDAMTYALTPLHGAAATLIPVPGERLGQVAGYLAADYLVQHARRARRSAVPPESWWRAAGEHCRELTDLSQLTHAADARARYQYVELLYRCRADHGDQHAMSQLAHVLERQGRMEEAINTARAEVAAGTPHAIRTLARLLVAEQRIEEAIELLSPPEDGSHWYYAEDLVRLLGTLDRTDDAVEVLRARVAAGDSDCASRLVDLFVAAGRFEDALVVLRNPANPPYLKLRLATLLEERGHVDEAIDTVKTFADTEFGAERLIDLLVQHGRVDELRVLSCRGNPLATKELAGILADQGRARELAALVDKHGGHPLAFAFRNWLADVLADQEAVDDLRRRADAGDESAGFRLAETLIDQDRVDEVRARATAGDRAATWRLAQYLEGLGRLDEAVAVWRSWPDVADTAQPLAGVLLRQGRVDEAIQAAALTRAEAGVRHATHDVNHLLDEYGRLDELRARAESGDGAAARILAERLRKQGQLDEALDVLTYEEGDSVSPLLRAQLLREQGDITRLRTLARDGDEWADRELVGLLHERGLVAELRSVAHTGSGLARLRLIDILAEQEDVNGLREWAATGETTAARHVVRLLAARDDLDGLRGEVDAGTEGALEELLSQLVRRRQMTDYEAERIRILGYRPE